MTMKKDACDDEEENGKGDVYRKFYVRECDSEGKANAKDFNRGMIRGDRKDISDDKEENVYNDYKENKGENIHKNAKENISGYEREDVYIKICMRECDAEGTGYEPLVLALRLDTPVIVYWDYIILDRLVDYIFREVFA